MHLFLISDKPIILVILKLALVKVVYNSGITQIQMIYIQELFSKKKTNYFEIKNEWFSFQSSSYATGLEMGNRDLVNIDGKVNFTNIFFFAIHQIERLLIAISF